MPIITAIKFQKSARRRKQRVNIFLDGQFAFALEAERLIKAKLKVGQKLTPATVKALKKQDRKDKLYDQVLKFLSYRPRSEKEIRDYLKKKAAKPKTAAKIVKKLKKIALLDDRAFAAWWVEQRSRFRPKGKQALRLELWQKGVDGEIIENSLFSDAKELKLARKASRKKTKTYQKLNPFEQRQKMTAFLARRGFSWPIIKMTLEELKKKSYHS